MPGARGCTAHRSRYRPFVTVAALVFSIVAVVVGVLLIVSARRRRLSRLARGVDPGRNLGAAIGAAVLAVGLLNLGRAIW